VSKVEELREQLNEHIVEFGATLAGDIVDDIASLIAAAREEGDLVVALRKAVIREASVGTMLHVKTVETGRIEGWGAWTECTVNGIAQARNSIFRTLPDGDYAIVSVPKETP
jgi:hypothetical protein